MRGDADPGAAWRVAWVALGANLGDARRALRRARTWLDALPGARVEAASRVHHTAPVGPPQPDYLNAVVRLATRLSPRALLAALHEMEAAAGRVRGERWGARPLDLDLLLYGERIIADAVLTVPHPRMHERSFVLAPLCDLDPGLRHPLLDRTMADLLNECVNGETPRQGASARAARGADRSAS